jgi:cytochrome c554/c'-like protein
MDIKTFVSASVLSLAVCTAVTAVAQDPAPAAQAPGYSWADSCKSCHTAIYDAWAKTKHATALDRLSPANQDSPCVGCHVTGAKSRVVDGRKVLNAGVQCEACHGGAAAHAADPNVRTGLIKLTPASRCEECHSDKGPHFKGFWYDAMRTLVHKTK